MRLFVSKKNFPFLQACRHNDSYFSIRYVPLVTTSSNACTRLVVRNNVSSYYSSPSKIPGTRALRCGSFERWAKNTSVPSRSKIAFWRLIILRGTTGTSLPYQMCPPFPKCPLSGNSTAQSANDPQTNSHPIQTREHTS